MAALQRVDANAPLLTEEVFGEIVDLAGVKASKISYGLPFDKAIVHHVAPDAKVYVLASPSLCGKTDALDRLNAALGDRIKGVRMGMTPHTIFEECLEVFQAAHAVQADTIVTLGGGSLTDAAKLVCAMTSNDLGNIAALKKHAWHTKDGKLVMPELAPNDQTLILIPTSLSGGEHTPFDGVTDGQTNVKYQISPGGANVTILDPWLCLSTPNDIWLQSGIRGVDHAVEFAVGDRSTSEVVQICVKALKLLVPGLLVSAGDTGCTDAVARLNAQLGVALAIVPLFWDCHVGASHGIGHMLGPMGVRHGETSCVLMPAVNKYNKAANGALQDILAAALWDEPAIAPVFAARGLRRDEVDLGDLLDAIVRALGLPRTLREVGIVGADKLRQLAENSLHDALMELNPRPITRAEEVMEILKMVEG